MSAAASPTEKPAASPAVPTKTKVDKAQSWLTLASTSAGVIGAVGTGAVWLIANFYTGTVNIKPDVPVEALVVKVYDSRGKECTFHSKQVQLMPGSYHLEVVVPNGKSRHFDTTVRFNETSTVNLQLADSAQSAPSSSESDKKKKKWYQFWRKSDKSEDPGS